jgi:hypothetical protein
MSTLTKASFPSLRRLARCNDPESYAGGSVATGRATLAGQVKGEHPDKERYTGLPGWGLGRWASTPSPGKKTHKLKNLDKQLDDKKNWVEGIRKAMNERNLKEGQWEDRKQWNLGVGQRRKTF